MGQFQQGDKNQQEKNIIKNFKNQSLKRQSLLRRIITLYNKIAINKVQFYQLNDEQYLQLVYLDITNTQHINLKYQNKTKNGKSLANDEQEERLIQRVEQKIQFVLYNNNSQ
ncbi:hypothetical protein pb186bvf_002406 [Paramecium bursaria]